MAVECVYSFKSCSTPLRCAKTQLEARPAELVFIHSWKMAIESVLRRSSRLKKEISASQRTKHFISWNDITDWNVCMRHETSDSPYTSQWKKSASKNRNRIVLRSGGFLLAIWRKKMHRTLVAPLWSPLGWSHWFLRLRKIARICLADWESNSDWIYWYNFECDCIIPSFVFASGWIGRRDWNRNRIETPNTSLNSSTASIQNCALSESEYYVP